MDDEQSNFCKSIIALSQKLNREAYQEGFPESKWKCLGESGLLGIATGEAFGGLEKDASIVISLLEILGRNCEDAGLNFSVCTQIASAQIPIQKYGSERQKSKYLPGLVKGTLIGAHAITEPESGSDAFSMTTSAVKKDNCYVLNGSKTFITNGPVADLVIVYAMTDSKKGVFGGLSCFIIEKDTPGFICSKPIAKMGLDSSPFCQIFFEDCRIPGENILAKMGSGFGIFQEVMKWEILCTAAVNIGEMERLLERCVQYCKSRKQFGKSISDYQAVSHKIADMKIGLEASRELLKKAGRLFTEKKSCDLEVAIAKVVTSENYVKSSLDALQLFGAYGYTKEYGIEEYVRNALASKIYSGTSEIQRNIIAKFMGL